MVIGITGSFGGGKSTVLKLFADRNWRIFDADKICHELYRQPDLSAALKAEFGAEIFTDAGELDRAALGKIVFAEDTALTRLNRLVMPMFDDKLTEFIARCRADNAAAAAEIPLLFEGDYQDRFDATLTVWSQPEIRRERLRKHRHFSAEEFARREARQLSADRKLELADFALINNGDAAELAAQLDELLDLWAAADEEGGNRRPITIQ